MLDNKYSKPENKNLYMRKRKTEVIGLVLIISSLCIYFSAGYGIFRGSLNLQTDRVWNGYYPVLVPADIDISKVNQTLQSEFSVVTYESSTVEYFNFNGLEKITLPDIQKRFSGIDSRMDPYMQQVDRYFFSSDERYKVIYCKSDKAPLRVFLQLRQLLDGIADKWVLIGSNLTLRCILTACFLLLVITAFFITGSYKILVPVLGLPWLPLIFFGPIQMIMAASTGFYAAILTGAYMPALVREYVNRGKCSSTRSLAYICGMLWLVVLLFTVFIVRTAALSRQGTIDIIYAVSASIAVVIFIIGITAVKSARHVHTLFFHIPLKNGRRIKLQFVKLLPVPVIMGLVLIIPLFVSRISPGIDTGIPQPGTRRYTHIDYDALIKLDSEGSGDEDDLPDIADYLKHRLYQKGWLYNVPYEIPKTGQFYTISTFFTGNTAESNETDAGGIGKGEKTVLNISDTWYQNEISSGRGTGIIDLLIHQDGWASAGYKKMKQVPFKRIEIVVYYVAWFALQLSGLFSFTHLTPITLYGNKAVELRRQYQAA